MTETSNSLPASVNFPEWVGNNSKHLLDNLINKQKRTAQFESLQKKSQKNRKAFDRTVQFWARSSAIYASYKVCQLRVKFVKDKQEQDRIWEEQHEKAADKLYEMCSGLGGFFLKTAQLLAKPDLAPMAWVKKLVVLCDDAPQTSYAMVQTVLEAQLGKPMHEIFDRFDEKPLGSASVAQVHRARLKGAGSDVAVKVQHPGSEELMMTDIRNQKAFAALLQRFDVKFDLLSVIDELEQQVEYEFDFTREANSMDRIAESLSATNRGKPPVQVPRSIPGMVTRQVLVMDFVEGTPILRLGDEMAKRGINPDGTVARLAKRNIMKDITAAYGQMILRDGFFQADPHPGNILINKHGKVALLDYGQVKELPDGLRLGYAKLVSALASGNPYKMEESFKDLGLQTGAKAEEDPVSFRHLAMLLFDTKLPPGMKTATPFGDETILKKVSVDNFPKDLFFVLRTVHILRGLSMGMGISYSAAEEWKHLAKDALTKASKFDTNASVNGTENTEAEIRKLKVEKLTTWEKRRRLKRGRLQGTPVY
ncbi:hypothetical protein O6H91_17G016100 [Diphasiastrum complanatum]|uniref:Uncharacterized protein n=1 Tax=Diphasiastrum complanatum TaxID=34168 RepID=A0ACC2B4K5_DIPCM|nr:hypothetical protein O6H91_17G016100 [Diphasiastrum complanatum]